MNVTGKFYYRKHRKMVQNPSQFQTEKAFFDVALTSIAASHIENGDHVEVAKGTNDDKTVEVEVTKLESSLTVQGQCDCTIPKVEAATQTIVKHQICQICHLSATFLGQSERV